MPCLIDFAGKAMNELGVGGGGGKILAHSPGSDCNSNHQPSSNSCFSSTSTQDIDFIQDNSDYQWFLDYNYRDGSTNHHTSILSLSEAYGSGGVVPSDIRYYDALSKNMDANLAEADMESFRTEDIHALLTNLPTMCTDPLSQETISRHGESFASVSGSMLAKFDFDSSLSPRSSSQCDGGDSANSMSICKSELLFSPVKESPPLVGGPGGGGGTGGNYSVDSLDCGDFMTEQDILLTCQANKDNYTIAFEGSITMYSEDSDFHESEKSNSGSGVSSSRCSGELKMQLKNPKVLNVPMAHSDSGGFTTWSNLKKRNSENQLKRHPSGNNNSEDTNNQYGHTDNVLKSQSMPDLCKQKRDMANNDAKNQNFLVAEVDLSQKKPVKVFDIQHQTRSCSGSGGSILSDMATSTDGTSSSTEQSNKQQKPNLNLVKLFMKQKSISAEGMSLGMDQSGTSETQSVNSSQLSDSKNKTEPAKNECFEDSLLVCPKPPESSSRMHELIVEEDEEVSRSESVEQLTESFSKLDLSDNSYRDPSPMVTISNNNNSSPLVKNMTSSPSKKISETRVKRTSTEVPAHLISRSIQTSCFVDTNLKNAPYKLNCNSTKDFVKIVEPSFLSKLKEDSENKKPVYVLYPNYVLPDLNFLQGKEDIAKVLLMPHKHSLKTENRQKRPFSCNDMEVLKEKGFSHVRDWDSLNFLLPSEFKKILADVPEVAKKIKNKDEMLKSFKPSFCSSPPVTRKARPTSCDCTKLMNRTSSLERVSTTSSVTTQPSSGYRGSSTILTDSQSSPAHTNNLSPLFVYRYDSVTSSEASLMASERNRSITTMAPPYPKRSLSLNENKIELVPPRPPLPKGILRRSLEAVKNRKMGDPNKRFSMFEAMEEEMDTESQHKRFSMQEHYTRNKRTSETEDEGVDAGTSSSSLDEHIEPQCRLVSSPRFKSELPLHNVSCEELAQLEEYLKMSGFSSGTEDLDEQGMIQLRSYVTKFLALKINQDPEQGDGKKIVSFAERVNVAAMNLETKPPNNSPNVSALMSQKHHHGKLNLDTAISEERETKIFQHHPKLPYDLSQKRSLISAVTDAVEKIVTHFSPASNQEELNALGDSSVNPACAKLALSTLCPALYAILSDGLKQSLDTTFGPITNSVWQVVEVSSHQGPLTKALNELVMRINSEDTITEGLVKFNAFVFGLLNVRSLDAWFSYLRTRESVLKKHYEQDSLLVLAHTGSASIRGLMDTLISTLEPLALLPFRFDLLFEHRQLHESLKRIDSYQQPLSPSHPKSPGYKTSKQWTFSKLSNHSNSDTDEQSAATTVQYLSPKHVSRNGALPDLLDSPANVRTKTYSDRPRSCIDPNFSKASFKLGEDHASIAKKRWSGISPTSKLYQAYERLAKEDEEEYTDSLETGPQNHKTETVGNKEEEGECSSNEEVAQLPEEGPDSLDSNLSDTKPLNGRRFKKLQMKWEMLSGKDSTNSNSSNSPPVSPTHVNRSKIPRPVTSPNRPSGIPVPISTGTPKNAGKPPVKKAATSPGTAANRNIVGGGQMRSPSGGNLNKTGIVTKRSSPATRTSRLDQLDYEESPRHLTRPSSLPYKPASSNNRANKSLPPRRAVSSSVGRKTAGSKVQSPKKLSSSIYRKFRKSRNGSLNLHAQTRYVKTLSHRMPTESGHLSYNAGDCLKVILEVDQKWLLCCRGALKGLVPKTDVIADGERF